MPAKSKSQQRLFSMALAVRKGKLKRTEVYKSVIDIVDSDMTDKEIEDFTKIKEKYQMKGLKEFLNESLALVDNKTLNTLKKYGLVLELRNYVSCTLSEDNFLKISKNKTVSTPFPNTNIKLLNGDERVRYTVIPKDATATYCELNDEDKKWYYNSIYTFIKDKNVYQFMVRRLQKTGTPADVMYFPFHELKTYFGIKELKGDPDNNVIGLLPIAKNGGTSDHYFTDKGLEKVIKALEFIGFKVVKEEK